MQFQITNKDTGQFVPFAILIVVPENGQVGNYKADEGGIVYADTDTTTNAHVFVSHKDYELFAVSHPAPRYGMKISLSPLSMDAATSGSRKAIGAGSVDKDIIG